MGPWVLPLRGGKGDSGWGLRGGCGWGKGLWLKSMQAVGARMYVCMYIYIYTHAHTHTHTWNVDCLSGTRAIPPASDDRSGRYGGPGTVSAGRMWCSAFCLTGSWGDSESPRTPLPAVLIIPSVSALFRGPPERIWGRLGGVYAGDFLGSPGGLWGGRPGAPWGVLGASGGP